MPADVQPVKIDRELYTNSPAASSLQPMRDTAWSPGLWHTWHPNYSQGFHGFT